MTLYPDCRTLLKKLSLYSLNTEGLFIHSTDIFSGIYCVPGLLYIAVNTDTNPYILTEHTFLTECLVSYMLGVDIQIVKKKSSESSHMWHEMIL